VRLVWHRIFQPSRSKPIDFEHDVEGTLLQLRQKFCVREVRFDPYQMQASAQRLAAASVPMVEFAQSVPNLTEASSNLFELIKGGNLIVYDDAALNKAIKQTVAIETTRGWRLAKEKTSARIDVVVALAQAALATVQQGQRVPLDLSHEFAFVPTAVDQRATRAALSEHLAVDLGYAAGDEKEDPYLSTSTGNSNDDF
jgi:phage terminase large subunit-like protein